MAAMIDIEPRRQTRRPGLELVVRIVVKLADNPHLREMVARKLRGNWSPEQIAGWLKSIHPGDEAYQVSHETIYRSLFVQARGVLKKELLQHLRSKRTIRRSRRVDLTADRRGKLPDMVSIRERPETVE